MWADTLAIVEAYDSNGNKISRDSSSAHKGFHLMIPNDYDGYKLIFTVVSSYEDWKEYGPFTNSKDIEWVISGSVGDWDIT
ncbi:12084_t:CDS:1, partial [Dentiscutata erythropus]